jgi:hypothetical protein
MSKEKKGTIQKRERVSFDQGLVVSARSERRKKGSAERLTTLLRQGRNV